MLARLVHGLGSGILFQTRHILAIMSTNDNHTKIQTWIFFTGDLGLAIGALFPVMLFTISGGNLPKEAPELIPSAVSLCIEVVVMLWVGSVFPSRLVGLPEGVRYTDWTAKGRRRAKLAESDRKFRFTVWVSGTTRIFVQSAMVPVVALSMRDANWTGNYRQTLAVASMFLMPLPFEAIAGSVSCSCGPRQVQDGTTVSKIISGAIGGAALLVAGLQPQKYRKWWWWRTLDFALQNLRAWYLNDSSGNGSSLQCRKVVPAEGCRALDCRVGMVEGLHWQIAGALLRGLAVQLRWLRPGSCSTGVGHCSGDSHSIVATLFHIKRCPRVPSGKPGWKSLFVVQPHWDLVSFCHVMLEVLEHQRLRSCYCWLLLHG